MCHLASFLRIQMTTDFQWPVRSFKRELSNIPRCGLPLKNVKWPCSG
jgi:hypothetical protein